MYSKKIPRCGTRLGKPMNGFYGGGSIRKTKPVCSTISVAMAPHPPTLTITAGQSSAQAGADERLQTCACVPTCLKAPLLGTKKTFHIMTILGSKLKVGQISSSFITHVKMPGKKYTQ